MTQEEMDKRVDRIIDEEILANQSSLISELVQIDSDLLGGEFDLDRITNFYTNPECMDRKEREDWLKERDLDIEYDGDQDDEDAYMEYLEDMINENADGAEIFQWFLVTEYLARQLVDHGEAVLDNSYGQWWGRQGGGQAIEYGGIIQKIVTSIWKE